jgi:hypothetical protein
VVVPLVLRQVQRQLFHTLGMLLPILILVWLPQAVHRLVLLLLPAVVMAHVMVGHVLPQALSIRAFLTVTLGCSSMLGLRSGTRCVLHGGCGHLASVLPHHRAYLTLMLYVLSLRTLLAE